MPHVLVDTEQMDSAVGTEPRHLADRVATIVGVVVLGLVVWAAVWASVLINFAADPCSLAAYECNYSLIAAGVDLAKYGAMVVGVLTLVVAVVRVRARRRSWWIPAVAVVAVFVLYIAGGELAKFGVQPGPGPSWSPADRPAQL